MKCAIRSLTQCFDLYFELHSIYIKEPILFKENVMIDPSIC